MGLSNELISQFVKATRDNKKTTTETTVYGTIVYDGKTYVKLDGSDLLTPITTTADVQDGERVTVMIKDHTAIVTGNISSPAARTDTVQELGTKISEFEIIIADKVSVKELEAEIARIDTLVSDNVIIRGELTAYKADITELQADNVIINEKLTAQDASIKKLDTEKLNADVAEITYATIEGLNATNADIYNLRSTYGDFEVLTTNKFDALDATVKELDTEKLSAEDAEIKYANIDFANIGEAAIEKLFSDSGIISDLVMKDGNVTGELVGVTLRGDLIIGETIQADKLVVQGSDGLYYKLNFEGGTFADSEAVPTDSLHGSVITAKSVTAEKVSVTDLVAFDATIGGFNITDNSLYSGVKSSADNTTRGIYLDNEGQLVVGDASNYLKYFKDSDGTYKLAISAGSIIMSASNKSVEEALDETLDAIDNIQVGGRNLIRNSANLIYTEYAFRAYMFTWEVKEWSGLTSFSGNLIWTDGVNIYYSSSTNQYVLNGDTWEVKEWSGLTSFYGKSIWTDGVNIYYSSGTNQYVLNGDTWEVKEWSGLTSFTGDFIWTDGVNIYYSSGTNQYVLNGDTWEVKKWSGLTSFSGNLIWTDGVNIYYSSGTNQYVRRTDDLFIIDTWEVKEWSGLTSFSGNLIWTDGVNIYYSSSTNQYVLNGDTWEVKKWSGLTSFTGELIWTDGINVYYSSGTNQYVFYKPTSPTLQATTATSPFGKEEECAFITIYDTHKYELVLPDITNVDQQYTLSYWFEMADPDGVVAGPGDMDLSLVSDDATGWRRYISTFIATSEDCYLRFNKVGSYYIYHAQLEIGNKATDWTPAPEDTDDAISEVQGEVENVNNRVNTAELNIDGIKGIISSLVTDASGGSLMTQNGDGWTFCMAETEEKLAKLSEALSDLEFDLGSTSDVVETLEKAVDELGDMGNYIQIKTDDDQPYILLGQEGSDFKVVITNTDIRFLEGSSVPAYISNKSMHIQKAVIEEELQQGEFVWIARSSGNLGLVWKGTPIITFYIGDDEYQAMAGQDWYDWCVGTYNTDLYWFEQGLELMVDSTNMYAVTDANLADVDPLDTIIAGHAYQLRQLTQDELKYISP